ncbi:RERE [Lepeophtheirus salmonis]|uniref:RERE n=1 Tax=Lepeophtheirus salmonis TaxID=72036 RepID=A0A7R8D718_LEPSM|nr:RERE [Lepeophtheirus salmonis]CAF3022074.1 RERE [Lepeophtheirus salmonis]
MSTPSDEDSEPTRSNTGSKKPLKGKVWKSSISGDYVRYRANECGTDYCPGDAVYIESQRPEQPYYVCAIQSMKMSKRDTLMVHVKWFYRTSEVPEQVYQLLVQDRHTEHGSKKYDVIHDPITRKRELFISDATDIYPVSVLRGKCTVYHCSDIISFRNFIPEKDTFFYTLSYNPETRRLASTQGEIRVGASHQAKLPELETVSDVSQIPDPKEDSTWEPGRIHDHDLLMYLRAGRSMAAFAAMCDGGSTEDGFATASRDSITANAIKQLHEVDYDTGKALQNLLKRPNPPDTAREWREDDIKDFIKGLRIYGKNFFKIKTEFLPQKETSDLINFYYLWKKSPGAVNNRPRGRRHRPNIVRRIKSSKTTTTKTIKDDPTDLSSASEGEDVDSKSGCEDSSENGEKELSPYYCRHCYSTSSKDWHHASKEKILVCTECRMYFKKYGELPTLDPRKEVLEDELLPDIVEENEEIKKEEETAPSTANASPIDNSATNILSTISTVDETSDSSFSVVKKEELENGTSKNNKSEDKPQCLAIPSIASEDLNLSAIEKDSEVPSSSPSNVTSNVGMSVANSSIPSIADSPSIISHSIASVLPPPSTSVSAITTQSSVVGGRLPAPPGPLNLHQPHLSTHHAPISRPSLPFGTGGHPPHPHLNMYHSGMFSPISNNMRPVLPPPGQMPHGLPHPMAFSSSPSPLPFPTKDPEVQILHHSRSTPTPPPPVPREPSPPPKPDGSECHRSQSAIFIRNWNRGEGNSCSRTDMYFKPVPESKLARKRDERVRKATNDEISATAAKMSLPPGFSHVPSDHFHHPPHSAPHSVMSRVSPHPHPASPMATSFKFQELERYERERKEEFLRMSMGGRMSVGPHPSHMDHFDPRRGFNPGPPHCSAMSPTNSSAVDSRRLEELARINAERQYVEKDFCFSYRSTGFNHMLSHGGGRPPHHPPPHLQGLDPRFNPSDLLGLRYPPPGLSHPELLQRQLMLERELLAAHGAAAQHQSLLAQQEEFLRLEQEARVRQNRP